MYRYSDSKVRRGTTYKVSFPTLPAFKTSPTKVYLKQKQGHHDILTLEFPVTSETWFETLTTGTPIKFSWIQGMHEKTWFGYVSFTTKEVVIQRKQYLRVQCIGGSFLLKQRALRVFSNSTITEALTTICNEFGIGLITQPSKRRFEQLIIPGISYWEWIQEQAKKLGYVAYLDGLSLIFNPIDKVIDTKTKNIPILSMHSKGTPFATQWLDRTLDYIEVTHGHYVEATDHTKSVQHVGGINPFTGEVIYETQTPENVGDNLRQQAYSSFFDEYRSDIVVETAIAAKEVIDGAAILARFTTPAKIKCQGDPRIHPYSPILIENTGTFTDGYWLVQDALHIFGRTGEYQMEITAVTDGTKDNKETYSRPRTPSRIGTIDVDDLVLTNNPLRKDRNVALAPIDRLYNITASLPSFFEYCWMQGV